MASNVVPLTFPVSGEKVRIIWLDGEPWWVAADVCRELGIAKPRNAVQQRVDEDDARITGVTDSLGREQNAHVVNEAGVYQLIFASTKPQAKAFKKWIFKEVIPAIRKTGSYESMEAKQATVLAALEAGDSVSRRFEWAKQRKEIPAWVCKEFARANYILAEAAGFSDILTTSGEIDDNNGVGKNRNLRFANGQQRSRMYKERTGRLPYKAPSWRRGEPRIVNQYPKFEIDSIPNFTRKAISNG